MDASEVHFKAGEVVFQEGDVADAAFMILRGSVEIRVRVPGSSRAEDSRLLATLDTGEVFGEMSIIDESPRSASATAVEPTTCLRFPADEVLALIESHPVATREILRTLVSRLRAANRKLARSG